MVPRLGRVDPDDLGVALLDDLAQALPLPVVRRGDDGVQPLVVEPPDRQALDTFLATIEEHEDRPPARRKSRERRHRSEDRVVVVLARDDDPHVDALTAHERRQHRVEAIRYPPIHVPRLLAVRQYAIGGELRRLGKDAGLQQQHYQDPGWTRHHDSVWLCGLQLLRVPRAMNHEAHEGHEGKPDKMDEGFETPADLAGPASPGRGVSKTRDPTRRVHDLGFRFRFVLPKTKPEALRLVGRGSHSHRLAAAGGRQVSAVFVSFVSFVVHCSATHYSSISTCRTPLQACQR